MRGVEASLADVRVRIAAAARRSGRPPDVTLVAVTKGVDADRIGAAIAAGVTHFGENRIQEAAQKIEIIGRHAARWHMVGHLQRNKVRQAVELFDVIQSVDSVGLAADLSRRTATPIEILLQVNVAGEQQKFGFSSDDLEDAIREIVALPRLNLTGLMTIAPMTDEPEAIRPVFRRLRELRDHLNTLGLPGLHLHNLSMGMSDDCEVAVEEGATIVRIGRALFGERPL
jgi:pyridoxal phosphate enzyme (YggS family)